MIYVECKPDGILVRALTTMPQREIIHEIKGKYEVVKKISRRKSCGAVIDEDPASNQPAYLATMVTLQDLPERGLKVLGDESDNRIVVMCPRLGEWTIRAAREGRVDVSRFNLPDDPLKLHGIINADLRKFERLVEDLKDSDRLRALSNVLSSLPAA